MSEIFKDSRSVNICVCSHITSLSLCVESSVFPGWVRHEVHTSTLAAKNSNSSTLHVTSGLFSHLSVPSFFTPIIRKIDSPLAIINSTFLTLRSLKACRTDPRPRHTNNQFRSGKLNCSNCSRAQPLQASDFYRSKPL